MFSRGLKFLKDERFLSVAFYSAVFLWLLRPLILLKFAPVWDGIEEQYPGFSYILDSIREGRFPLWDPFTNCGYPLHAEAHRQTLNPLTFLLAFSVTDNALAFVLFWLLHWYFAGIGTFVLCGRLGARPGAALVSALTFVFCGFFIAHAEHLSFVVHAAYLPWVLAAGEAAVGRRNVGYALIGGLLFGVSTYGGYPPLVAATGLMIPYWLILRFPARRAYSTLTYAVMALVCLILWFPILQAFFYEGAWHNDRTSPLPFDRAMSDESSSFQSLLSLFLPYITFLGRPWMGADISMTDNYIGLLSLSLSLYFFIHGENRRFARGMLLLSLLTAWFTMGGRYGLRDTAYLLIPPFRYVRYTAIFRVYWMLALAVCAGLGWQQVSRSPQDLQKFGSKIRLYLVVPWLAASAVALVFLRIHGADIQPLKLFLPSALIVSAVLASVRFAWKRYSPLALSLPLLLVGADAGQHFLLNRDTVMVRSTKLRSAESRRKPRSAIFGEPGPRTHKSDGPVPNFQLINKTFAVRGYNAMRSRGYTEGLALNGYANLLMSKRRFWITRNVYAEPRAEQEIIKTLSQYAAGGAVPVFVKATFSHPGQDGAVPGTFGNTAVTFYAPERVDLEAEVPGPSRALLASTERWARSWEVSVDGRPAKVLRMNLFFRAVELPPGKHMVTWIYRPWRWYLLVRVSAAAALLCFALGLWLVYRSPRFFR